jgi:hypothetical protein
MSNVQGKLALEFREGLLLGPAATGEGPERREADGTLVATAEYS